MRKSKVTPTITCQELVELVTEYLEATLSPADRARIEEHLGMCAGCRTYIEQIRQTIRALGHLHAKDLSEQTQQELLEVFRHWKKE